MVAATKVRPPGVRSTTVDQALSGSPPAASPNRVESPMNRVAELAGRGRAASLAMSAFAGLVRGVHRHPALLVVHEAHERAGQPLGVQGEVGDHVGARPAGQQARLGPVVVGEPVDGPDQALGGRVEQLELSGDVVTHLPILTEGVNDSPPCRYPDIGCTTWIS